LKFWKLSSKNSKKIRKQVNKKDKKASEKTDKKLFFLKKKITAKKKQNGSSRLKPKKIKRGLFKLKSLFYFLLFLLFCLGFYFFIKSSFFAIRSVDCQQEGFPCQQDLFLEELRGENIFFADTQTWAKKTKDKFLNIASINIKKQLPAKVFIEVRQRQPLAAFTKEGRAWYLVDADGVLFDFLYDLKPGIVKIYADNYSEEIFLGSRLKDKVLLKSLLFSKELSSNFIQVDKIMCSKFNKITVLLSGNITATFSAEKAVAPQVDSLQFILKQSKIEGKLPDYIDFRYDKPVIK